MNLNKLIRSFNFKKFGKASRTDFGVLKVAFMVAALDGEVSDAEYRALDALARKCRGYTPKVAAKALDEAMRSAGYLMLFAKRAKDTALVEAFMAEAQAALPNGFAYFSVEDVRRAIVTWIAMGMSDGDYSAREKKCVEALLKHFAELKVRRTTAEADLIGSPLVSPAYRPVVGCASGWASWVPQNFARRVEQLVAEYGDKAEAERALKQLMSAPQPPPVRKRSGSR